MRISYDIAITLMLLRQKALLCTKSRLLFEILDKNVN